MTADAPRPAPARRDPRRRPHLGHAPRRRRPPRRRRARAGRAPRRRSPGALRGADGCIVDLTARAYDGLAALAGRRRRRRGLGGRRPARRRGTCGARPATPGAARVYAYRALFEHGDRELGGLDRAASAPRAEEGAMTDRDPRRALRGAPRRGAPRRPRAAGLDALLVGVGADLRYLAGYDALPLERLTLLVLPADRGRAAHARRPAPGGDAGPDLPGGRRGRAGGRDLGGDRGPDGARRRAAGGGDRPARRRDRRRGRVGRAARRLRAGAPAGPARRGFSVSSAVLRALRMRKDADEVALLRDGRARRGPRRAPRSPRGPLVGRTEADVAREVRDRLVAEGHERAEFCDRRLGAQQRVAAPRARASASSAAARPIVIDIGGTLGGYGSDITRTVWVTGPDGIGPDAEFLRLYDVLQAAQAAATAAVRPGVACEEIDGVARRRIADAGYGPQFFHRTGHGIGLEGARGAVPRRGQRRAARARAWRSASSPASTSRAGTGPGSRTSWSAARPARTCSTSSARDLLVVTG